MGPIIIFDKSALQCLSIDESVWLDNYFLTNITPLFYVETLADLSLKNPSRPPEKIISELAIKTPRALPNIHHLRLVLGNLLGQPVEVEHGRPIVDRGVTKKSPDGKIGIHISETTEEEALSRWHKGEYQEIERMFATRWRQTLDIMNFDSAIGIVKNILPAGIKLSTLEDIKLFVDNFVQSSSRERLILSFDLLGIPDRERPAIVSRWESLNMPLFDEFASYAMYVLKIDLFFYIAALKSFISKERPSNKVDLAYLYYLPFCHVFVSGDNLHARTAPLFIRENQTFITARDFKAGLTAINKYFTKYSEQIAEIGVMKFAAYPPVEIDTSIHKLWDKHCPSWRKSAENCKPEKSIVLKPDSLLLKHLNELEEKSIEVDSRILENMDEADHLIVKHMVPVQKGRWRILPKGIEDKE
ncbi:MAG: hypothetical protein UU59_C0037G0005 [candidate division WWE3 bacterium GW2011_GWE1_41_27]|uniref:Uncharacterized protein n=1 Tax=candidate division WWE3 bacterium GW2011_GWE1_41_27 TaxID=1619131 RepID=A0A0G0VYV6_UNCKA|nr:MAG: hypothetical protein UU59_C0037G0005 [candidate division WWE3 bacterium GW2011_GWE1_41_27]